LLVEKAFRQLPDFTNGRGREFCDETLMRTGHFGAGRAQFLTGDL